MYCRYCGEKQQADAKFCHRCGKLLEIKMASENEKEKEEFFRRRKDRDKVYVFLAVLIFIGLIAATIIVPIWIGASMKVQSSDLYGSWDCGENEVLYIDSNGNYELYNSVTPMALEITGTYDLDWDYEFDGDYMEYDLDLYVERYMIDGVTDTGPHLIEYEGIIYGYQTEQLLIQNKESNNVVRCIKIKD